MFASHVPAAMIQEEARWCNTLDDAAGVDLPLMGRARKRTVNFTMSVLDAVAGMAFFLATLGIGVLQKRVRKDVDNRTVTIGDYTVLIGHLPKVAARLCVCMWGRFVCVWGGK